jgi:HAD superfamily hydrolase (TIGR01490 family)
VKLAIFDLDNTLIGGDSDFLWGQFLCEHGYLDAARHEDEHQRYYVDYRAGKLDIDKFLEYQLRPLAGIDPEILLGKRKQYLEEKIRPILLKKADDLVDDHRSRGHVLLVITATNRFLTEPIAGLLGIENLIASDVEMKDGFYTGKARGLPAYAGGKVTRLKSWLEDHHCRPDEHWFYSDSHNDLPLLEYVTHPVAVDPDTVLRHEAEKRGWPIISLR